MRIGIYTNLDRDIGGRATKALLDVLLPKKYDVVLCEDLAVLQTNVPTLPKAELAKKCDMVVVFGGDGTILRIAKECAMHNTDIFAVNLGHLGFLSEVEQEKLMTVYYAIVHGKYRIDTRHLLEVSFEGQKYYALNEAVVERGPEAKLVKAEVFVDGTVLDRYNADGLIVATPTGSTAYSLSAGGPIVSPDVRAFIIAPICPHSLHSRPVVVSNEREISVKILKSGAAAQLNIDGEKVAVVQKDEIVTIKKAPMKARFIRLKEYNYYEKLLEKLCNWSAVPKE